MGAHAGERPRLPPIRDSTRSSPADWPRRRGALRKPGRLFDSAARRSASRRRAFAVGAGSAAVAVLVAAGALVLAGAAVAVGVEVTTRTSSPTPVGNAVAAVEADGGQVSSYTATGTTPSNVVVGGGSVWVLNADDRTISRIDPKTRRIVKTFAIGGLPTDLAFGSGSLWVGNGTVRRPEPRRCGLHLERRPVDPDRYRRHRLRPASLDRTAHSEGAHLSQLAAYGGSLWAINPDLTVSRIDTSTNRVVDHVPVTFAGAIAAGKEGVWVARNGSSVTRIDPRTGRIGQTISVPSSGFAGIAVGDGSVWTAAPNDGTVWRIEPGLKPMTRTISVGFGVTFIAFARGAVWTANFIQGTVSGSIHGPTP